LSGVIGSQEYRQFGNQKLSLTRAGFGGAKRFSDLLEANVYLYGALVTGADFAPFTSSIWLTLNPGDTLRADISYDRQIIEDISSLKNKIITEYSGLSLDYKPDRFWCFNAKYRQGSYSDENEQKIVSGKIEYRLFSKPYFKIRYEYYRSIWAAIKNSGYFNPNSVASNMFGVYASSILGPKISCEAQFMFGYENQIPVSDHPVSSGFLAAKYEIAGDWFLQVRAEYFDTQSDAGSNGYQRNNFMLGLSHIFGFEKNLKKK
jgi:hypothetical protein